MKKNNRWAIVKDEGEMIIEKIISGECKSTEEFHSYCDSIYCWNIADKIKDYVGLYLSLNGINLPWSEPETDE